MQNRAARRRGAGEACVVSAPTRAMLCFGIATPTIPAGRVGGVATRARKTGGARHDESGQNLDEQADPAV
jgi:hypothetical protein